MAKLELLANLHGIGRIGEVKEVSDKEVERIGKEFFQKPSGKTEDEGKAENTAEEGAKNRAIESPKKK